MTFARPFPALLAVAVFAALALTRPTSASAASPATISAAWHRGALERDGIAWRTAYVLREPVHEGDTLLFAAPLPAGVALDPTPDATPITRDGRLVGLTFTDAPRAATLVSVVVHEPGGIGVGAGTGTGTGTVHLHPPLAFGGAVQIVDLVGDSEQRFEPDPRSGLSRHMGFFAPDTQPMSSRLAAEYAVGYGGRGPIDQPMYVEATALHGSDGAIDGELSNADSRMRAGTVGAVVVFVGVIAALLFGHRALSRAAKIERAEQVLNEEFTKLDDDAPVERAE